MMVPAVVFNNNHNMCGRGSQGNKCLEEARSTEDQGSPRWSQEGGAAGWSRKAAQNLDK